MQQTKILVDNIKCGGCANNVSSSLQKIEGIENVKVNIEAGSVAFQFSVEENKATAIKKLAELGYPAAGTSTAFQKGKSYVSCMIGKIQG